MRGCKPGIYGGTSRDDGEANQGSVKVQALVRYGSQAYHCVELTAACRTSTSKPSLSLLKRVCAPVSSHVGKQVLKAKQWGINQETRKMRAGCLQAEHANGGRTVSGEAMWIDFESNIPSFGGLP